MVATQVGGKERETFVAERVNFGNREGAVGYRVANDRIYELLTGHLVSNQFLTFLEVYLPHVRPLVCRCCPTGAFFIQLHT